MPRVVAVRGAVTSYRVRLPYQLGARRKARGWSRQDIADRLGVSRAAVAKLESGRTQTTALAPGYVDLLADSAPERERLLMSVFAPLDER